MNRCSSCGGPVDPSSASLQFERCRRCLDVWSDEEKALLRAAIPPVPLSRDLIERCVRAAKQHLRTPESVPTAPACATEPPASNATLTRRGLGEFFPLRDAGRSGARSGGFMMEGRAVAAGGARPPAAFSQGDDDDDEEGEARGRLTGGAATLLRGRP